jgi:hypothetical protein
MNFTGFGSQSFKDCKKKEVSFSLSPVTNAPAMGLLCKESVASNNPLFRVPNRGRFFLFSPI